MLERMKKAVERVRDGETKVNLSGLGLGDKHILVLKEVLEKKPHITEVYLTRNNMTDRSGRMLSEIKSLKRIHAGQNSLGDEGAKALLSQGNVEFLDLTGNGITTKIKELLEERGQSGVTIITSDNPRLYPEDIIMQEKLGLGLSYARFKTKEPATTGDSQLSDAVSMAKFGLRRSSEEDSNSVSSPSEAELKFEEELVQQLITYVSTHPKRCDALLSKIANRLESVKKTAK